jgi:hypothetical protein
VVSHIHPSVVASHARPLPTPSPGQTSQPASSSSGDISALDSALIGLVGAIIGAVVGGAFTLWAAMRQSRSEREATRLERSKQAAMDIAAAWPVLEEALEDRAHTQISADDFHRAFNAFSRTATMQCIPIVDKELRRRIRGHRELLFSSTLYADDPVRLSTRVEGLRTNGVAIAESIDAHYNDKPLPDYSGPLWPKSPVPGPLRAAKWWEFWKRRHLPPQSEMEM